MPSFRSEASLIPCARAAREPGWRGFTLVEILTVLAIVALLAAIALPAVHGLVERTALSRARAELSVVVSALEVYRRIYGDYPETGSFTQASSDPTEPLVPDHAQAKLFAALQGKLGPDGTVLPAGFNRAPTVDVTRLPTEFAASANVRAPDFNALVDPWGRRYLYFYKEADNPAAWGRGSYVLYSAGPDGRHQPPDLTEGASGRDSRTAVVNADNVYADALSR